MLPDFLWYPKGKKVSNSTINLPLEENNDIPNFSSITYKIEEFFFSNEPDLLNKLKCDKKFSDYLSFLVQDIHLDITYIVEGALKREKNSICSNEIKKITEKCILETLVNAGIIDEGKFSIL
jgi:hypothetical protein